jgi:hypothetical protein
VDEMRSKAEITANQRTPHVGIALSPFAYRLISGYQRVGKPPRKNTPTKHYYCETVDYIP